MATIAKESENSFETPPAETVQAVCAMVSDIGTHLGQYQGKQISNHQIVVLFELASKDSKGFPFQMAKFYTLSLSEKANLRKDLQAWRGKPFTTEELKGFDVDKLVNANCLLSIIHEEKEGKTKAKISAIMSLPKGMQQIHKTVAIEPEWIGKKRAESLEMKGKVVSDKMPPAPEDDLPF